jgi:general secretion pathway protein C
LVTFHDNAAMATSAQSLWFARIVSFLLASLAAGSLAFWVLKWTNPMTATKATAVQLQAPLVSDSGTIAKVLGGGPAEPTAAAPLVSARFVLVGVLAGKNKEGAALIAVDGKPAKPVRVGGIVGEEWTLRAVQTRRAVLARGGEEVQIDLPVLPTIKLGR